MRCGRSKKDNFAEGHDCFHRISLSLSRTLEKTWLWAHSVRRARGPRCGFTERLLEHARISDFLGPQANQFKDRTRPFSPSYKFNELGYGLLAIEGC